MQLDFADRPECSDDPELFFPTSTGSRAAMQHEQAKSICRRCPFRAPCLAWALEHDERGIWGGTTHEERHDVRWRVGNDRMTRYQLYQLTQQMIEDEGMTPAECAKRLGLNYSHVLAQRRLARQDIDSGRWRP